MPHLYGESFQEYLCIAPWVLIGKGEIELICFQGLHELCQVEDMGVMILRQGDRRENLDGKMESFISIKL